MTAPAQAREGYEIALQQKVGWWWSQRVPEARCMAVQRINGTLDPETLRTALEAAAGRHEIFATVYQEQPGLHFPSQVVTGVPLVDAWVVAIRDGLDEDAVAALLQEAATGSAGSAGSALNGLIASAGDEHLVILSASLLAADERSLHRLIAEAADAAGVGGQAPGASADAPELVQYSDYAGWQLDLLEQTRSAAGLEPGYTEVPLPITRPAGAAGPAGFRSASVELGLGLTRAVRQAAASLGVDEEGLLFGCWALLLAQLGAGDRFSLGAFRDGRTDEELADAAGPFEVCVPVTADIGETAAEVVRQAAAVLIDAASRLEAVLAGLESRLRADGPVEAVLPSFRYLRPDVSGAASRTECLPGRVVAGGRPALLGLTAVSGHHGISATVSYDRSRFDDVTASTVARLFPMIVAEVTAHPEASVAGLVFVDETESSRAQARGRQWVRRRPVPDVAPIALFRAAAQRSPERVAVTAGDQDMTFGELARRADQFALELRRRGIGPGDAIMIALERTPWMIIAVLGTWRAGAAYVPLDLTTSADRLAANVNVARPALLVTEKALASRFRSDTCESVLMEESARWPDAAAAADPLADPAPDSAAYIIFTSGSSGIPKGVLVSHRSLATLLAGLREDLYEDLPPTADLRVAINGPLCFDTTVKQLIQLCDGRSLCLVKTDVRFEPDRLLGYLRSHRVDVLDCTPSVLRSWIEEGLLDASRSGLKHVLIGGEAIPADLWEQIQRTATVRCTNLYGPTECTVDVTTGPITGGPSWVSAGRPLPNVEVSIRDRAGRHLPPGLVGELCVTGPTVALGYVESDDTGPSGFTLDSDGQRMYRTGDLARFRPDGTVDIVGRADRQLKIRGYRVEPGDAEAWLRRHPSVRAAAVAEARSASGRDQLVAYLVTDPERPVSAADMQAWTREHMMHYMWPDAFVLLGALPLTPNGKVDYRSLPLPPELRNEKDVPHGPVEETLASIWREVLGVESPGRSDDFFSLGGDSILCIQVIAKAKRNGLPLKPSDMFKAPTIAGLASLAAQAQAAQADSTGRAPARPQAGTEVPLTPIQCRFFERGLGHVNHWNQSVVLELPADVEPSLAEQAFRQVVAYHDTFRLRFAQQEQTWTQRYGDGDGDGDGRFETIDLRGHTGEEAGPALAAAAGRLQTGLDIRHGPVISGALVLAADQPARLLLTAHHLVMDAVSWHIVAGDLDSALRSLSQGQIADLGEPSAPFSAWADALRTYQRRPQTQQQAAHWADIEARTPTVLPRDRPQGRNLVGHAADLVTVVDQETTARLMEVSARLTSTTGNTVPGVQAFLLAALTRAVRQWSGHDEIQVDLETHGREDTVFGDTVLGETVLGDVDVSRTVGWFTAIWPLAIRAAEDSHGVLRQVTEALAAVPDKGVSYGVLRYLSPAAPRSSRRELCFGYMGQVDRAVPAGALVRPTDQQLGQDFDPEAERSYLLELYGGVLADELHLFWTFSQDSHDQATIAGLSDMYCAALRELVAIPG